MIRNLNIFKKLTTKTPSISPRNLSEKKEPIKIIKNSNFLIKNEQRGDFPSKNIILSLPTLNQLI